jgi:hypothetical protein
VSRKYTLVANCGAEGCRESAFYGYSTQKEYGADYMKYVFRREWRCVRHANPEKYLTPENMGTEVVLTATPGDGSIADHMFWHDGSRLGSGYTYGPGFNAHARNFPPGTRLVITARIELPEVTP